MNIGHAREHAAAAMNFSQVEYRPFHGYLIFGVVILVACVVAVYPPIPQAQSYHNFADQRMFLGTPNALNVLSNVPFLLAGIWGMWAVLRRDNATAFATRGERWPYLILFGSVALTCFGSGYYHLDPNNGRLVWDRLPMAIGFMSLTAAVINERIRAGAGTRLLIPLVLLGAISVVQWYLSEMSGRGDLRFYAVVQYGSLLVVLLLIAVFRPRYSHSWLMFVSLALYVAAKVLEGFDRGVYQRIGFASGHTLKHLFAAAALGSLAIMLRRRTFVPEEQGRSLSTHTALVR